MAMPSQTGGLSRLKLDPNSPEAHPPRLHLQLRLAGQINGDDDNFAGLIDELGGLIRQRARDGLVQFQVELRRGELGAPDREGRADDGEDQSGHNQNRFLVSEAAHIRVSGRGAELEVESVNPLARANG